jgi:RNA ligase (TIGR02306 family)
MSTLKVEVVKILKIEDHPNADRLDIATIKGWQCIVRKGDYKEGDKVVYFPIDSILPPRLEERLFPPESKIKLHKSRVRTIKIRGSISQGLIVRMEEINADTGKFGGVGHDVTKWLGVTKYEPPVKAQRGLGGRMRSKKQTNLHFHKYTDIENFKNYPDVFKEGELVSVTEKIHGTNGRAGWVKYDCNTWWKRVKRFFGIIPEYEFVFGSHNVQLQDKPKIPNYYKKEISVNVYAEAVKKYRLKEIIPNGVVIYFEIYGSGIQKGYTYGCKDGERKLVVFDIKDERKNAYEDPYKMVAVCDYLNLPTVRELYRGPFDLEKIKKLATGDSVFEPSQKVIEGVVIKPVKERTSYMGRTILKLLNDEYLLKKGNTELH